MCWFIALSGVCCFSISLYFWSLQRQTTQDSLEEYPGIADAINKYIAVWHWWWCSAFERKHTTGHLASACCWVLAFVLPQVWHWFSQFHIYQTTNSYFADQAEISARIVIWINTEKWCSVIIINFINIMQEGTGNTFGKPGYRFKLNPGNGMWDLEWHSPVCTWEYIYVKQPKTQRMSWHARLII